MLHNPNVLALEIGDLQNYLNQLELDEFFPVIDTEALMSVIISLIAQAPELDIEEILSILLNDDYISDRLELDKAECEKLVNVLYNLTRNIKQAVNDIKLYNTDIAYRYISKRKNNLVLLQRA